ncbi:MAG TPA: farnesyl diphosphate synthase [Alphaproteobacteria bacterium]
MTDRLQQALAEDAAAVETALAALLPERTGLESRLFEAMRYATLGGGKRLRPFLVLQGARLFAVNEACAMRVACAVEMVHCYSLIHDDLPAMDDDDVRRGRPTVHKQFDEATAILAGDALLTAAFAVLADPLTHADAQVRAELVLALANAAGAEGMVGGQMIDLAAEHQALDIGAITRLQRLKTGALFCFSAEAGAILGKAPPPVREALRAYAQALGLAFQMADDLLDAEGSASEVGKRTGKDAARGKATFVSLLGAERARAQAKLLAEQAAAYLDLFGEKADLLRDVARWVVDRRH